MHVRNILVPTDFSSHSQAALEWATQLAKLLQARIHLLHAYFVTVPVLPHGQYVFPVEVIETVRHSAQKQLAEAEQRVVQAGVACQTHLSADHPASIILDLAKSMPADLIVLGTRGLTGLKHVALGSVAERVARLATCPVLTVKSADADPD